MSNWSEGEQVDGGCEALLALCNMWFLRLGERVYRVVQLKFIPEIEVFHMLFERSLAIFTSVEDTRSMDDI